MYKVRNIRLYFLNHTLFKSIILSALFLVLSACGYNDDHQTSQTHISGNAVKGIITNGLVSAYLIEQHAEHASSTVRKLLGQARTNRDGEYQISISTLENDSLVVLELTADSQTTMRCDLVDGCLYPNTINASNILLAEFGEELPLPGNFKLLGYIDGNNQQNAFISPLSHIIYTTASSLPGGISGPNLDTASRQVAQTFNLETNLLSAKTPDLTALSSLNGLSNQQLKLGVLSSAFYELTMLDSWSNGDIDLDQLPLEDIFRNAAYSAEILSQQLSAEQNAYSEALFDINTEAEAFVQTFESKQLVIFQQPNSLIVNESHSFSLHVQASGDGDLSYQWAKNNLSIPLANSASYHVTSANLNDAGSYSVTITSNGNYLTSLNALISVKPIAEPVAITQQPLTLNLTAGDPINLSVEATGDVPLHYQWQKEGSLLLGETNNTLYIEQSTEANSGTYRVTVSNALNEASSKFVSVVVIAAITPLTISQQPQNLVVVTGGTAHFQVNASGGGFVSYQWRKNSINIANAYTNQLIVSPTEMNNAGDYDVIVTNSIGSIISNAATLTVLSSETPISITLQPTSESVYLADSIKLRTAASGDGLLSYQWFFNGEIISGANQAEYSIGSAEPEHEGNYTVIVNNTYSSEESLAAFISVNAKASVQLSWDIPAFREDGSPLDKNEISAYVLEYGDSPSTATGTVQLTNATTTHHTFFNVEPGILYARIATIDSSAVQGQFSNWLSITIE
jgi:hypothetical protein